MKFTAHDIINNKPLDLFKISLSNSGEPIAFEDLDGEIYGRHQVHLYVDTSILTNESVFRTTDKGWYEIQNIKSFGKTLTGKEISESANHIKQQEVHMQKHETPQKIDPGVLTLRWNNEDMKKIMLEHIKNTGIDVSDFTEVSLWYEEESNFISGANCDPHYGFVMRITKKIK